MEAFILHWFTSGQLAKEVDEHSLVSSQYLQPDVCPTADLSVSRANPANTKHLYNIYTASDQRLRRWSTIV